MIHESLPVSEVAKLTGLKPDSVRKMLYNGEIHGIKDARTGRVTIPREAVAAFLIYGRRGHEKTFVSP